MVGTSAFHRLLPAEDSLKPAAGDWTFRPWKLQCPRECLLRPLQEDLKSLYFLISHGLLQSLVSFRLLLCFGSCSAASLPLRSLPRPLRPSVTTFVGYRNPLFIARCVRRQRHSPSTAFSTRVPWGFTLGSVPWLVASGNGYVTCLRSPMSGQRVSLLGERRRAEVKERGGWCPV